MDQLKGTRPAREPDVVPEDRGAIERLLGSDLAPLVPRGTLKTFEEGAFLCRQGDVSDKIFVVAWGRLKAGFVTREGRNLILGIYGPGDAIGFATAVSRRRLRVSIEAASQLAGCIVIDREQFLGLIAERPDLLGDLLPPLTKKLHTCTNCLVESVCTSIETRLARLFLRLLAQANPDDAAGTTIPVRLSRRELAELTGTTVETCSRIMSRWRRKHAVMTSDEGFEIRNRAFLKDAALG